MIDRRKPDFANTPASLQRPAGSFRPADTGALPAVTFVTPFYNAGSLFEETARSIQRQTLQQWEWLIVNDGSDDAASLEVLDAWRERDPRIRVVDHPGNRGLSAARNTGFREASAEYVIQVDSDDLLEATAAEKMFWFLQSYPGVAFVKGYTVGFGAQEYLWERGFHCREAFLEENQVEATCMVRRSVHQAVGGYDERNRGGLEDWDFWLRCADAGYWGDTIAEFLTWYRRRPRHDETWAHWDGGSAQVEFRRALRQRYPRLWKGAFPDLDRALRPAREAPLDSLPVLNRLAKGGPRLLLIVPWLTMGGADRFNLDLTEQLVRRGWEVSIATTLDGDHSWEAEFARFTPDISALHRFLEPADHPRFLRYLITSRGVDVVLVSNSEMGYQLLPYLRSRCPEPAYVDFCHMEEEEWNGGGYPRVSVQNQAHLDLSLVASAHLKRWMVERGAEADRVAVCHLGVDAQVWKPDAAVRERARAAMGLSEDVSVILYAARLAAQKQPQVFAATIEALRREGRDLVALVAGDGELAPWLERFVDERGMRDCVRMLGPVDSTAMQELMAASDIFFLPSQWEGIALSIYEAMSCGLAVVGADVGGQTELVVEGCGILLQKGEPDAEAATYAAALARLMEEPGTARAMGSRARDHVRDTFSTSRMGDRLAACMRDAMDLHAAAPRPSVPLDVGQEHAMRAVQHALACRPTPPAPLRQSRLHRKLQKVLQLFSAWKQRLTP